MICWSSFKVQWKGRKKSRTRLRKIFVFKWIYIHTAVNEREGNVNRLLDVIKRTQLNRWIVLTVRNVPIRSLYEAHGFFELVPQHHTNGKQKTIQTLAHVDTDTHTLMPNVVAVQCNECDTDILSLFFSLSLFLSITVYGKTLPKRMH